jgi:hypothetical protein
MKLVLITSTITMIAAGIYGAVDMGVDLSQGKLISYDRPGVSGPVFAQTHSAAPKVSFVRTKKVITGTAAAPGGDAVEVVRTNHVSTINVPGKEEIVQLNEVVVSDTVERILPVEISYQQIDWAGAYSRGNIIPVPEKPKLTVKGIVFGLLHHTKTKNNDQPDPSETTANN